MKLRSASFAAGLAALLLVLTPAFAHAERTYILVGARHIYLVGDDQNSFLQEREEVEKTYADCITADFATSQYRIANGGVAADENRARTADLKQLSEDRDDCLDELYETRDDLRDSYPGFKDIDCEAPYQLVALDYHVAGANERDHVEFRDYEGQQATIDYLTPLAPWPGYEAPEEPFGGWVYGRRYRTTEFFETWHTWRARRRAAGISLIAFSGHGGRIPFERGRFVGRNADFVVERGYAHATGRLHKKGVVRRKRTKG